MTASMIAVRAVAADEAARIVSALADVLGQRWQRFSWFGERAVEGSVEC